jgi:protein O-mannosyl-transferase
VRSSTRPPRLTVLVKDQAGPPGRRAGGRAAGAALLVALVVVAVFLPALDNGFVNWDDDVNFTDNPNFRGFSAAHLGWMFTTTLMGHYIPLTWLTLALDHAVWGMNPRGYHLTSVLLHAVDAALVFLVARRLLGGSSLGAPAVAALAWGLHPLRAESVAWVTERRDVLSGLFVLLALLAYLRAVDRPGPAPRRWLAASLVLFAASLLSKAITMTFPVVLLVLDTYPLGRRALREKAPFFLLAMLGAGTALVAIHTMSVTAWEGYGAGARVAVSMFGLAFYVSRTLLPLRLSPLYEMPPALDPLAGTFVLSAAVVLGLTGAAIWLRRRAPWFSAAWAAYVVMVLPVAGPVHTGLELAHDRYSYLSCLPWALLGGAGVGALLAARRRGRLSGPVFAAAIGAVVLVLAGWGHLTREQTRLWRNSETLWEAAVDVDPACSVCRSNLGRAYLDAGRLEAAERELRTSVDLRPGRANPHNSLGVALYREGRLADAAREFRIAVRLKPGFAMPFNNLGVLQARMGALEDAQQSFETAVRLAPDYAEARDNLARVRAGISAR